MIKFFQKIRYNSMETGKTGLPTETSVKAGKSAFAAGRYLKYAIGEIVLVVVGILIALQINNWNEKRKINTQETVYLQDLKKDFNYDLETLNRMISKNDLKIKNITTVLSLLSSKDMLTDKDKITLLELHTPLFAENYFIPEKGTINQIESSSSSSFIQNKELRDLIFRYYSDRDREDKNMEQSVQLYQHNYVTPRLISATLDPINSESLFGKKFDFNPIDMPALLFNKEYLSALGIKMGMTTNQNRVYKNVQEKAEQILIILSAELNL